MQGVHAGEPTLAAMLPGKQGRQLVPSKELAVPAGHSVQVAAPKDELMLPGAHAMQAPLPA